MAMGAAKGIGGCTLPANVVRLGKSEAIEGKQSMSDQNKTKVSSETAALYWRENVKLVCGLLVIWFAVSFGAGILFVESLNNIQLGGFKLGFWFAQQGSIFVFVILIFVYAARMRTIEKRFGVSDD